jgi:hypothetical protein
MAMIQILKIAKKQDVKCMLCRSRTTILNKKGAPVWRYDDNNQRICYRCFLDKLKSERENNSRAARCQSALCVKSRLETGARPDYKNKAHCVACKSNHHQELITCPCCSQKLRRKARYNMRKKICD